MCKDPNINTSKMLDFFLGPKILLVLTLMFKDPNINTSKILGPRKKSNIFSNGSYSSVLDEGYSSRKFLPMAKKYRNIFL